MPTAMTFNNKAMVFGSTPAWLALRSSDPYNPLGLPPFTVRIKLYSGLTPHPSKGSATLVDETTNVWDITYENPNWYRLLSPNTLNTTNSSGNFVSYSVSDVLGANSSAVTSLEEFLESQRRLNTVALFDTSHVTTFEMTFSYTTIREIPSFDTRSAVNMHGMFYAAGSLTTIPTLNTSRVVTMALMFYGCGDLVSVPALDMGRVTTTESMFQNCGSLTTCPSFDTSHVVYMGRMFSRKGTTHPERGGLTNIPLLDTSSAVDVSEMFYQQENVQSGSLALYQQLSSQTNPPMLYADCFKLCGSLTQTGSAELAQIPTSWGGTLSA